MDLTKREEYFNRFKALYKEDYPEEFEKMTNQQLFESFTALITLVKTVHDYRGFSKEK